MNKNDYISYLIGEISKYNFKSQKHILEIFQQNDIVINDQQPTFDNFNCIDVINEMKICQKIEKIFSESDKAIMLFEKWEFEKDYKYSSLFCTDSFSSILSTIEQSIQEVCERDYLFEFLDPSAAPIIMDSENRTFLKINFKFENYNFYDGEEELTKYPVIIVFHKKEEIIEVRFDSIFRDTKDARDLRYSFEGLLYWVETFLKNKYDCQIEAKPLEYIKSVLDNEHSDSVKITYQDMTFMNGGRAKLAVGKEEYNIPIIGDLKILIAQYSEDLSTIPRFKSELDNFIYENEELSDYNSIAITWIKEIKTRNISIKIVFKYKNTTYNLIQHYSNNVLIGMERMNHVIKYIGEHKNPD